MKNRGLDPRWEEHPRLRVHVAFCDQPNFSTTNEALVSADRAEVLVETLYARR